MNDDMLSPQSRSIEMPRRDRITAISSMAHRRPIVIVLGMHRSGTSLCSHLLSALGVDMADKIAGPGSPAPTPDNPRGHWERWEIVEFHDRILGLFNRDYFGRFHDFALPVAWWADPRVAQIRREIVAFLESRMGDGYFGLKDPRTVRLMPVWHQIFNELKLAPKLVLCLRNPAQVARSLHARDGLDPANGEYRWLAYMIDFYRYTSNYECCAVEYEEWFDDPAANIEKLRKFLDLPWQQGESDLALLLSDLIDPTARHDDPEHHEANQPLVRSLYKLASRAGRDGEARDQIAYIVSQFVGFQQLQRPFQRAFEEVAKVAAKFPEVEQAAVALRAAVDEREAVAEAANVRAAAVEGRLAEALAEIEQQQAQIAKIGGELQTAQADAAVREAALVQAQRVGQERTVTAEVMQAEVATLQAPARAEQKRAIAAEAAQAEVATLHAALAQAEYEAVERGAAVEATQAEIGALRETLAQADRAEQKRTAPAEEMQAEVGALWDSLGQLREEAQQREDAAAAVRDEFVSLRGTLARAEGEAQQRASTAQALEAEVRTLRGRLAQVEGEARERAETTAALQTEITTLRGRLAQTQGEASERAATATTLQSEIETLQGTLAAAREVGKAAITAFRIETAVPVKPEGPHGWRQAVARFLGVSTSF
jgi:hypothetical protein